MTHIITGLCLRSGTCLPVCPVDCIVPGLPLEDWPTYVIDRAVCIDCGLCIPACPYNAIMPEAEVPDWLADSIALNDAYFERGPGYPDRE